MHKEKSRFKENINYMKHKTKNAQNGNMKIKISVMNSVAIILALNFAIWTMKSDCNVNSIY